MARRRVFNTPSRGEAITRGRGRRQRQDERRGGLQRRRGIVIARGGEEKGEAGGRRHPCRRPLSEDNTSYMTSESTRWMRKEPSKAEVERCALIREVAFIRIKHIYLAEIFCALTALKGTTWKHAFRDFWGRTALRRFRDDCHD